MNELNNDLFYPEKPNLEDKKESNSWIKTILSIILFIATFMLVFNDQFTFILILVICLFVHELGHFLMMKLFGYQNVKMIFVPLMGAFVQGKKRKYSQFQSLLVVAAGPFPGMLIGTGFMLLFFNTHYDLLLVISIVFLALNLINLLPLDPLDGGQLFKFLLQKHSDLFLLIFAFISSLFLIAIGFFIENWYLMGFGFFMAFRVRNLQKNYFLRKILRESKINHTIDYSDLSNRDYSKIKEIVLEHNNLLKKMKDLDETDESQRIIAEQVNNVLIAPMNMDASLIVKLLIILYWIASFIVPFWLILQLDSYHFNHEVFIR
jgi:Zn-dependent protease